MRIIIHPGHNPDGKVACGAVGILRESTCARNIVNEIKRLYPEIEVFSVEDGKNQQDVLNKIVERVNDSVYDLSISVHLNAANTDAAEGVEAYLYNPGNTDGIAYKVASKCLNKMEKLGYRNRGIKWGQTLKVINSTKCPSILLECGFVTNPIDCKLFNATEIAKAIIAACGLKLEKPQEDPPEAPRYRVIAGAFKSKENAQSFLKAVKMHYPDAYIQEV